MSQIQTYDACKYFDSKAYCPHHDDEIMKNMVQDIPEHYQMLTFPGAEQVNKICNNCESFILRQPEIDPTESGTGVAIQAKPKK